jgi:GNAT superfamily N-acetyltransferase
VGEHVLPLSRPSTVEDRQRRFAGEPKRVIERAETEADIAGWCDVWSIVTPRDPTDPQEQRRAAAREPRRLYLVAKAAGQVVGLGFAGPSQSVERTALAVRVLSGHRRRGLGSELFERLLAHASDLGPERVSGMVFEDDSESIRWAQRRGFEEYGRQVELSRSVARQEDVPSPLPGIQIVELGEDHIVGAHAVSVECYPDMPVQPPIQVPAFEAFREEVGAEVAFVALDSGRVVGFAGLHERTPGVAEHGLTAVLRSHRGRGIATALKQAQIRWASENGYQELSTWTQDGNAAMQAVNLKLGYRRRPAVINVWRRAESQRCR